MHQYAISNDHRIRVIYCIAAISIITGMGLGYFFHKILPAIIGITLTPPSTFFIFMCLFHLYDKFLWRVVPFSKVFRVPTFSGTWQGHLHKNSIKNGKSEKRIVSVFITQTWTKISICLEGQTSDSKSQTAFLDCDSARPELTYEYISKKRDRSETSIGLARLVLNESGIKGDYFSELSNKGPIVLNKGSVRPNQCNIS